MGKRFLRFVVGVLLIATLVFTILPSFIIWIINDRFYIGELAMWVVTGEFE